MGSLVDDERCEQSDLPKYMCAHCKQVDADPTEGFKLSGTFKARFTGACGLSDAPDHLIVAGKTAGVVEDVSNPFKGEKLYCCARCVKRFLDRARG